MKSYYAYIRVSTVRQGTHGVSLEEQRDAILRFAERHGLPLARWFEERETAAKQGRRVFSEMVTLLKRGQAAGVVIHKIDRGARNHKDWAEIGEIIDAGIDVRFAAEDVDLKTRGGRLSADIQAVVAADYIRNLREEVRKGFYGRLKQGFYPMPAPLGYTDQGAAKPKLPHPILAPLVRQAFELYASANYSLHALADELRRRGLRGARGGPVRVNALAEMLRNPFYTGVIRIQKSRETFRGVHEPLIGSALFARVQDVMDGRLSSRRQVHAFLFRRLLRCAACGYSLIGERQKGRVYYRCHLRVHPVNSAREDLVDAYTRHLLTPLGLTRHDLRYCEAALGDVITGFEKSLESDRQARVLRAAKVDERLHRLTDGYLDGVIDADIYAQRKEALLLERRHLETAGSVDPMVLATRVRGILELAVSAQVSYEFGSVDEKRAVLEKTTSNRIVDRKTPVFTLREPFVALANRPSVRSGGPSRSGLRTWIRIVRALVTWVRDNPNDVLTATGDHSTRLDETGKWARRAG